MPIDYPRITEILQIKDIFLHFNMHTGRGAVVRAMLLRIYTPILFRIILSIFHREVLT